MKDTSLDNLVKAIRKILTHQVAVSDAIATSLINRATLNQTETEESRELNTLSDREIQVMELLCSGINNLQIAERMGISPKTVGTYKARLMEKLGVRTTPELLIRLKKKWLS
jgi:two-component system response regulator NreC